MQYHSELRAIAWRFIYNRTTKMRPAIKFYCIIIIIIIIERKTYRNFIDHMRFVVARVLGRAVGWQHGKSKEVRRVLVQSCQWLLLLLLILSRTTA